jgi:endonuclease III
MKDIAKSLLDCSTRIEPHDLFPTLAPEASKLISDNPFAFLLAVSLDRGTKAEIIWTIPFWIKTALNHLDPCLISAMEIEDIRQTVETLPRKPRYTRDAPRTIRAISRLVCDAFGGDATKLWQNKSATETKRLLLAIPGIGDGIASMALILLERCRGIRFPDWSFMDVKADVHVQRVLYRLGVAKALDPKEAIAAAQQLNPDYPGALDPPLWIIGRCWCKANDPACTNCWMTDVCPKVGVGRRC